MKSSFPWIQEKNRYFEGKLKQLIMLFRDVWEQAEIPVDCLFVNIVVDNWSNMYDSDFPTKKFKQCEVWWFS